MLEWIMRLNDYFFNQLLGALSDANPYQSIIDEIHGAEAEETGMIIE